VRMTSLNSEKPNSKAEEWWAVYTRHQHEKTAVEHLSRKGLETFLPLYNAVRQWKDRKKHLSLPLFPCYAFVRCSPERGALVLGTPGVRSTISIAGRPVPIPESEINAVRRAVESSLGVEPHPFVRHGDWIRIKSGPLAGIEGILIRRKGSCRLILSAELLQKSIAVEVDARSVELLPRRAGGPLLSAARALAMARDRAADWQEMADREFGE
jgi:transcription termination/antitermination protein NusG